MTGGGRVMAAPATSARVTIVCTRRNHAHHGKPARINDVGPLSPEQICKLIDRAYTTRSTS